MSVCVQGPNDSAVKLSEQTTPEDPNAVVMMPSSISLELKQIKIGVICAYKLPDLAQGIFEGNCSLNPYFKIEWAGKTV